MSIAKTLIQKEIARSKRAVAHNLKVIKARDFKGCKDGYVKYNALAEKAIKELETDLKKL